MNPETSSLRDGKHDEPTFDKPGYNITTIISSPEQLKPAMACLQKGQYMEARDLLDKLREEHDFLNVQERLQSSRNPLPPDDQEARIIFETWRLLGLLFGYYGDYKQALQILEMALDGCEALIKTQEARMDVDPPLGRETEEPERSDIPQQTPFIVIQHMICLARAKVYLWKGEYDAAYYIAWPILRYFENEFGPHQLMWEAAFITGSILSRKFDKSAEDVCSTVFTRTRTQLGVHHPISMEALGTLVDVFRGQCRHYDAHQHSRLAAGEAKTCALEPSHPIVLEQRARLGDAKLDWGDFLDGKVELQAVFDAATAGLSDGQESDFPHLCRYLAKLARANYLLWNLGESEKQLKDALRSQAKIFKDGSTNSGHDVRRILRRIFAPDRESFSTPIAPHPDILESLELYADILSRCDDMGRPKNHHLVLEILRFVYGVRKDRCGSSHVLTLGCGVNLAIELTKHNNSTGSTSDTCFLYGVIPLPAMSRGPERCDVSHYTHLSAAYHHVIREWVKCFHFALGAVAGDVPSDPTLDDMFHKCVRLDPNHVYSWKAKIWILLLRSLAKTPNFRDQYNLPDFWPKVKRQYTPSHPFGLESWTKLCVIDMNLGCHHFTHLDVDKLLAQLRTEKVREQKLMLSLHLENALGTLYCSLEEYERGLPLLRQLQRYLETLVDSEEAHVVVVKKALESFKHGVDRSYKQAVLLAEKVLAKESIVRDTYMDNKQKNDAERVAGKVIGISKGLYGEERIETFKARRSLAEILYNQDNDPGKRWKGYFVAQGVLDEVYSVMGRPVASEQEPRNDSGPDQVCESAPELKTEMEPKIENEDKKELQKFFSDLKMLYDTWSVAVWKPLQESAEREERRRAEIIEQREHGPEGVVI